MELSVFSFLSNFILLLVTSTLGIVVFFKYKYTYWQRLKIPVLPTIIPFGSFAPYILQKRSVGQQVAYLYNEFKKSGKKCGGIYMLANPVLLAVDPEMIRCILSKDFQNFNSRGLYYEEEHDPLTANLLTLDGDKWKKTRSKVTPAFSSGRLKMIFQTVASCSRELEGILDEYVRNDEPLEVKTTLGRFTMDVIGSSAFGIECNSLKNPDNEFRKNANRIFSPTFWDSIKEIISSQYPNLFIALGLKRMPDDSEEFFMDMVRRTVEYREKNKLERKDFMQLLIQLRKTSQLEEDDEEVENGNKDIKDVTTLTMKQITAHAFVFFLAGFETSATTLTSTLYELAINQDIQDKLRKEIHDILKKNDGKITYEAIMDMTYMEKVLDESMRRRAAVPVLIRSCNRDCQLSNFDLEIKEKIPVFIPVDGIHMDPEYYPNPEKFDPERFSPEEKAKRHPYTFLPFGAGPRNCIGLRFAMMQMKVALTALMKNYKYTLNSKTKIPLKLNTKNIMYTIEGGVWLNAHRIK